MGRYWQEKKHEASPSDLLFCPIQDVVANEATAPATTAATTTAATTVINASRKNSFGVNIRLSATSPTTVSSIFFCSKLVPELTLIRPPAPNHRQNELRVHIQRGALEVTRSIDGGHPIDALDR